MHGDVMGIFMIVMIALLVSFINKDLPKNNFKYKKKMIEDINIEPISTTSLADSTIKIISII
jgi:hypothetical protein